MSFFEELKRRNVFKVGIAYVVAAWLLLQLTEVLTELLDLPDVAGRFVVLILIVGFFPAIIFAWAFELTPDGIKREHEVDRSQSITPQTGRKLDFVIIGMLVVIAGYFIWEARFKEPSADAIATPAISQAAETLPVDEAVSGNRDSIAVLPFANRSNQDDDLFFTDGIHDDLLTQLAKIGDLKVISRTSVMEYRNTTMKIPEIAAELGVGMILEGGVQRAGKRIRINAQLIDVNTDEHLWAETFDREMTMENIFDIQSEITRHIVQAVRGELTDADQQAIAQNPTDNLEAYEAYLRSRAATNLPDYGREKYQEAEPWALRAVELDPDFALAWALLAEIHGQAIWIGYDDSPERFQMAHHAIERASALAPNDAKVIAARADMLYRLDNDYPAAYAMYKKAERAAPGDAQIINFKAVTERRLGLWEASIVSFERAHELDPANVFIVATWAETLMRMRDWKRLEPLLAEWLIRYPASRDLMALRVTQLMHQHGDLEQARIVFDLTPPTDSSAYFRPANNLPRWERDFENWFETWEVLEDVAQSFAAYQRRDFNLGVAYHLMGDEAQARTHFQQYIDTTVIDPQQPEFRRGFLLGFIGLSHAFLGNVEQALETSRRATGLLPVADDHLFGNAVYRMETLTLALVGQQDEAIDRLEAGLDQPEGYTSWELQLDPVWDFMRGNGRFDALVASRQIREEAP